MNRRRFLQASLAGFIGAMTAFKGRRAVSATPEFPLPAPEQTFDFEEKVVTSHYAFEKGTLYFDDREIGCLFDTLFLNVSRWARVHGEIIIPGRVEVHGGFQSLVAPANLMQEFFKKYGDVCQTTNNTLKVGLERADGGTFYFAIPKVVLTEIGACVAAQEMSFWERTRFISFESPCAWDSTVELYEALATTKLKDNFISFTSVDLEKAIKELQ